MERFLSCNPFVTVYTYNNNGNEGNCQRQCFLYYITIETETMGGYASEKGDFFTVGDGDADDDNRSCYCRRKH